MLLYQVERFGNNNWGLVASYVMGKSERKCKEKWDNELNPATNRGEWTRVEDAFLKR